MYACFAAAAATLQVKERRSNLPLTQQKRHDPYELLDRSSSSAQQ